VDEAPTWPNGSGLWPARWQAPSPGPTRLGPAARARPPLRGGRKPDPGSCRSSSGSPRSRRLIRDEESVEARPSRGGAGRRNWAMLARHRGAMRSS
jgi:hypothetical protein